MLVTLPEWVLLSGYFFTPNSGWCYFLQILTYFPLLFIDVICCLQVNPEFRRISKIPGKSKGCVHSDTPFPADNFTDKGPDQYP